MTLCGRRSPAHNVSTKSAWEDLEYPELPKLRVLVDAARARLAELETAYTIDKARVGGMQAGLFQRLRTWCQERDRLRLVVELSPAVSGSTAAAG